MGEAKPSAKSRSAPVADIAAALRADFADVRPRFPWYGADLQTLRNTLLRPSVDLLAYAQQRLTLRFRDGDETLAYAHSALQPTQNKPCILIVHGLGGDARGSAVKLLAATLLASGFGVVRINLRGAPEVYHLASGISHAGKTDDLYDILSDLEAHLGKLRWGLLGISLGGNLVAKALGDGALADFDVAAAMTLCAPIDMQAASDRILAPRNWLYEKYLLRDLKNAVLRIGMADHWKTKARSAKTVFQFDDQVTGPFHGYDSAAHYYRSVSAGPVIDQISVPTLLLAAANDPWIPAESFAQYRKVQDANAQIVLTPHGGHVGYHFMSDQTPAYCGAALRWFTAMTS